MKSKIIKAVGKEILSLVCIILSIIGLLFIGHWLYSISNMLVWIVLGILFLGYIGSVVYSCIDAPAVSYWYIVYYHSRGQASLFLPKEDDFFNSMNFRIEKAIDLEIFGYKHLEKLLEDQLVIQHKNGSYSFDKAIWKMLKPKK